MTTGFLPSRLPIIQAPMAGSQGVDLCVSVCEAGGLGSLPSAMLTPASLRGQIDAVRARTRAPFNVNFFCHVPPEPNPERAARWVAEFAPDHAAVGLDPPPAATSPGRVPFDEAMAEVVEETRPPVVSFHFGLPDEALLERVKRVGAKIYSSATSVEEARWLDARGIDAVIAAGGIADGRGIAAAFALGARAAQIGTAYLLTPQATTSAVHRAALASARDDATRLANIF